MFRWHRTSPARKVLLRPPWWLPSPPHGLRTQGARGQKSQLHCPRCWSWKESNSSTSRPASNPGASCLPKRSYTWIARPTLTAFSQSAKIMRRARSTGPRSSVAPASADCSSSMTEIPTPPRRPSQKRSHWPRASRLPSTRVCSSCARVIPAAHSPAQRRGGRSPRGARPLHRLQARPYLTICERRARRLRTHARPAIGSLGQTRSTPPELAGRASGRGGPCEQRSSRRALRHARERRTTGVQRLRQTRSDRAMQLAALIHRTEVSGTALNR